METINFKWELMMKLDDIRRKAMQQNGTIEEMKINVAKLEVLNEIAKFVQEEKVSA